MHTPGHAPNHLCFLLEEERVLFTGDTVLEGMYSVVKPARGGDMARVPRNARPLERLRLTRLCPGHGDVIEEPRAVVQDYVEHRNERERQVLARAQGGPRRIPTSSRRSTATASCTRSWSRRRAGRCTRTC